MIILVSTIFSLFCEEAKKIENYIVYGGSMDGFKEVAAVAPISKMSY